jgi:hypothetical protein
VTDYAWPSAVIPASSGFELLDNSGAFPSPLSGTLRTIGRGGDRWAITLEIPPLTRDNGAVFSAFVSRLRGKVHRALVPDHAYVRRGALTANFLVKGGSQTGSSLVCDGATASVTSAMRAGDWITVENYLYKVLDDVNTNGSGELTLSISPPLHKPPADNATVNIMAPTCRMYLEGVPGWTNQPGGIMRPASLRFIEDITP